MKNYNKDTLCVRGGYKPKIGEPMVYPLVQITTFKYEDPDLVADIFDLKADGHMYSRISNPTVENFEEKIAYLEGGVGAVVVSSGQAAVLLAILNICKSGDNIISVSSLYGGTYNLFNITLRNFGANIVIHSTSKYIDGHAVALGGIVVDCGNFDWDNGKFPLLCDGDVSCHDIKYVEEFRESAYITKLRA